MLHQLPVFGGDEVCHPRVVTVAGDAHIVGDKGLTADKQGRAHIDDFKVGLGPGLFDAQAVAFAEAVAAVSLVVIA